jgi:Flp pilus assembly protein TadG
MKRRITPSIRGQSLVEFALIVPLLLLIVFFLLDVGRAVYYYSVIYNAAREGARYGIIHPADTSGIQAAARELAVGLNAADLTITVTHPSSTTIQVNVLYRFRIITPLVELFLGRNQINLSSTAVMIN